jgi:DNA-binding beta-propeller fold protein YncE
LKAQAAVLVSSRFSNAVKEYDEQGNFIRDLVPSGSGGLYDGDGLAIGPDGNLYVANFLGGNVLRYNGKTGEFMMSSCLEARVLRVHRTSLGCDALQL